MDNSKFINTQLASYSPQDRIDMTNVDDLDDFNDLVASIYNNASNDDRRCIVFPDDISNSKYYQSELLILLEIIKNTKQSLSILTRKLPMFEQEGGLFYGDKRLVDAIHKQMETHKTLVLKIISLDEPEDGKNNKLLKELQNIHDYKNRVQVYTCDDNDYGNKINERFIISDSQYVKYVENNKQTSIFLPNEEVASDLLSKFNSLPTQLYK